jgi:hypothetical protein
MVGGQEGEDDLRAPTGQRRRTTSDVGVAPLDREPPEEDDPGAM